MVYVKTLLTQLYVKNVFDSGSHQFTGRISLHRSVADQTPKQHKKGFIVCQKDNELVLSRTLIWLGGGVKRVNRRDVRYN